MRACSHPSGSGPSELDLLLSTAAATAATLAAAAVFRGSSHVVVRVKWLQNDIATIRSGHNGMNNRWLREKSTRHVLFCYIDITMLDK